MQTKQQIQTLLASAGTSPNKRLGQNFLIDLNLMGMLIKAANLTEQDVVLEVGTGTGSLTEELIQRAGKVITVELDKNLSKIVKRNFARAENLQLFNLDILESKNTIASEVIEAIESARREHKGRFLLVANLPYSVASPVMLNLTTGPVTADAMYVTVQKEVALRMTATESTDKNYGILSIILAATGTVKIIRLLKPTVFWPKPQVDSAMVCVIRDEEKIARIHNMQVFCETVSLLMGHRRKMLRAAAKLATGQLAQIHDWHGIFEQSFTDPRCRPEELSPESYVAIANLCCEKLNTA